MCEYNSRVCIKMEKLLKMKLILMVMLVLLVVLSGCNHEAMVESTYKQCLSQRGGASCDSGRQACFSDPTSADCSEFINKFNSTHS